jgi:hypothetical protein
VSHTQQLAVDLEHAPARSILNPEVVADAEHLLAHLVPFGAAADAKLPAVFLALFAPGLRLLLFLGRGADRARPPSS